MTWTSPDRRQRTQTRTYERASSVVFPKTKEVFGSLSNIAGGFCLRVNGIQIRASEALYQTCRERLIADVVTGKLDARAAAILIPDEADALGPPRMLEAVQI